MRAWRPARWPAALVVGGIAVAAAPQVLAAPARLFIALCAQYPPLATVTLHAPPLPASFVLLLLVASLANGGRAGAVALVQAWRGNRGLRHAGVAPPTFLLDLAAPLGLPREQLTYLPWHEPAALCYGLLRPRVAITAGLCARLDDDALVAVLAHELHHVRRRDPLYYFALRVGSATACMFPLAPVLRHRRVARRELAADRAALAVVPKAALAAAMLAVIGPTAGLVPGAAGLTATEARIAHLAGRPLLPPIPRSSLAASFALVAFVSAVVLSLPASAEFAHMVCEFCRRQLVR